MADKHDMLKRLKKASFRKIEFLMVSDKTARGRRLALHEFPNTDKRFVEDLGKIPPKFSITAWLADPGALNQRAKLEAALLQPGKGKLSHPVYGDVDVFAQPFIVDFAQSEVGLFKFTLNFVTGNDEVSIDEVPTQPGPSFYRISSDVIDIDKKKREASAKIVGTATADAIDVDVEEYESFLDQIQNFVDKAVRPIQARMGELTSLLDKQVQQAVNIVSTPGQLREAMDDVYLSVANLADSPRQMIDTFKDMTDFPDYDIGNLLTIQNQSIAASSSLRAEQARLCGLAGLGDALIDSTFLTTSDVEEALLDYNARFERIVLDGAENAALVADTPLMQYALSPIAADHNIVTLFHAHRNQVSKALGAKRQNAWRVSEKNLGQTSLALATYRLYGSLDNVESIRGLNDSVNAAGFSVPITILED